MTLVIRVDATAVKAMWSVRQCGHLWEKITMTIQSDMQQAEREIRAWLTNCTPAGAAMEGLMDAYLGRSEPERKAFVAALIGRLTVAKAMSTPSAF